MTRERIDRKNDRKEADKKDDRKEDKREEYGDVFDIAKDTMAIHARTGGSITKDFNLAIRGEKEDRFITRHMQVLNQEERFVDMSKVDQQYSTYLKTAIPDKEKVKEMKNKMEELKTGTMKILENDIVMLNILCRNKDGVYFKKILSMMAKRIEEEQDKSALERMPLLGGLFRRGEEKKEE